MAGFVSHYFVSIQLFLLSSCFVCLGHWNILGPGVNEVIGGPPDIVFECVGKPGVIAQAIDHVRIRGTVVVLGLCTLPDSFIPFTAVSKEIRLQMSAFFDFREFCTAVDVLEADRVQPHALITGTVSLDEAPAAFEELKQRTTQCKVLINPAAQG